MRFLTVVAITLAVAASHATAADIIVDSFDNFDSAVWPLVTNAGTPSASNSQSGISGVVGGVRNAGATWMAGPLNVTAVLAAGNYFLSSDALTDGQGTLSYPGPGGLNLDLSQPGLAFVIEVVSSDLGGVPIDVTLSDGGGSSATTSAVAAGGGTISMPLTSFAGIDFSDVDQIDVRLDPAQEFDITLDLLAIITTGFPDCNSNNIPDATDIVGSTSVDCDINGVPDECENMIGAAPQIDVPIFTGGDVGTNCASTVGFAFGVIDDQCINTSGITVTASVISGGGEVTAVVLNPQQLSVQNVQVVGTLVVETVTAIICDSTIELVIETMDEFGNVTTAAFPTLIINTNMPTVPISDTADVTVDENCAATIGFTFVISDPCGVDTNSIVIEATNTMPPPPGPGVDDCAAGPEMIAGPGPFDFDNSTATTDGPAGGPLCSFIGGDAIDNDVWFCWTASITGDVTLETCGQTGVDTKIAIYDGCTCPTDAANLLACDDDDCSPGLQSRVTFPAVAGNPYLIRLGTFSGALGGTGQFSLTCDAGPVTVTGTDNCADGPAPISGVGEFTFDNSAATIDGLSAGACLSFGLDQVDQDLWYCWTAPADAITTVETCALTGVDTKIAVYDGCACPVDDTSLLDCNDDTCGLQSQVQFAATMGNEYLLRVGTFPGAGGGSGAFRITCGGFNGTTCGVPVSGGTITVGTPTYTTSDNGRVITGSVPVSDLIGCPATVQITLEANNVCDDPIPPTSVIASVTDDIAPVVTTSSIDDQDVDTNCVAQVPFSATITDNCCVDPDSVSVEILVRNATQGVTLLGVITNGVREMTVAGAVEVSALTDCPADVFVEINAADCCGNPIEPLLLSAEVRDRIPPVLTCPADATFDRGDKICSDDVQNWLDSAVATDNCPGVTVADDSASNGFACGFPYGTTTTVTFTATDVCGNTDVCSADITIKPAPRVSTTTKGSLLIFPKVELRWNAAGELIQDTILTMTNDYNAGPDVTVQMYFINGDDPIPGHPGWNAVDADLRLTPDQPTYWSAASGEPGTQGGLSFTILDPPVGRPDPDAVGETMLRGYIVAYAVDLTGQPVRWNHLFGEGTVINYALGTAWSYNAYVAAARCEANNGDPLQSCDMFDANGVCCSASLNPGVLGLDGFQYDFVFDRLLFDFLAENSLALSSNMSMTSVTSDLTLLPVSADLRAVDSSGFPVAPVATKASFVIHNANEAKRTGTERCITCWDQTLLGAYGMGAGSQNWFLRTFLGTDNGKAIVNGIDDAQCDVNFDPSNDNVKCFCGWCPLGIDDTPANSDPRDICTRAEPLLGVIATLLDFDGLARDCAGHTLRGRGTETAVIRVDTAGGGGSEEAPSDSVDPRQPNLDAGGGASLRSGR